MIVTVIHRTVKKGTAHHAAKPALRTADTRSIHKILPCLSEDRMMSALVRGGFGACVQAGPETFGVPILLPSVQIGVEY